MGELWDGITGFFGNISEYVRNYQISAIVNRMQLVKCRDALDTVYNLAPPWLKGDQGVKDFYDMRYKEFTDSNTITLLDAAAGPGVDYIKAFIKEFEGLYDNISDALGGTIAKLYSTIYPVFTGKDLKEATKKKLGGTNVPAAIEGILDSIVDLAMDPILQGEVAAGKEYPEDVKTAMKEILKMSAGLGATIGLGGFVMEHWHPTKTTNAARSLNMILELVGYRSMRDAYIKPLRYQAMELPLRYKWNSLIQAQLPTQGEITGLARKYEITKDKYREAMAKQGVDPEWVEALLQGFWADPRLFEIIRLMEVERPPPTPPEAAKEWLTKAGLEKYIGPDWWLAMKFAKAGYDEIDIPVLTSAVKARNLQKELGDIRTVERNKYKEGRLDRTEYEDTLVERGISLQDSKELIDALDDEIVFKDRVDVQKGYERKYLYGRITKQELEAKFTELGMRENRIASRVDYLFTMKEGKLTVEGDEKSLTVAKIVNAYKWGQKTKAWAALEIDNMGYSTEDALLMVESVDQKIKNDTKKEWQRAAEAACLAGRLSIEELKNRLIELGYNELWAAARVAYIEERQLGKEKEEEEVEEEEVEE